VARKIKNGENETQTLYDLEYGKSEKLEVWVIHTVGPGFWWENWKTWKMRHKHCMIWNIVSNNEKREKWEMPTVEPGIWRQKSPRRKMINLHCRSWNMARKLTNEENEKLTW
jgi:hypothetical protein